MTGAWVTAVFGRHELCNDFLHVTWGNGKRALMEKQRK